MQNNEFEKFLKDNQIDVESVTAPLLNTSRSFITRCPKKVVAEESNQKMKIQGNVDGPENNVWHKTSNLEYLDSISSHFQNKTKKLRNGESTYITYSKKKSRMQEMLR